MKFVQECRKQTEHRLLDALFNNYNFSNNERVSCRRKIVNLMRKIKKGEKEKRKSVPSEIEMRTEADEKSSGILKYNKNIA